MFAVAVHSFSFNMGVLIVNKGTQIEIFEASSYSNITYSNIEFLNLLVI